MPAATRKFVVPNLTECTAVLLVYSATNCSADVSLDKKATIEGQSRGKPRRWENMAFPRPTVPRFDIRSFVCFAGYFVIQHVLRRLKDGLAVPQPHRVVRASLQESKDDGKGRISAGTTPGTLISKDMRHTLAKMEFSQLKSKL